MRHDQIVAALTALRMFTTQYPSAHLDSKRHRKKSPLQKLSKRFIKHVIKNLNRWGND